MGPFPTRIVIVPRGSGEYLSVGPTLPAGALVVWDGLGVGWRESHSEGRTRLHAVLPGGRGGLNARDLGRKKTGNPTQFTQGIAIAQGRVLKCIIE